MPTSKRASWTWQGLIRPNILALQPYRCARDDYSSGVLLDANENALGHSLFPDNEAQINGVNGSSTSTNVHDALDGLDFHAMGLNRYPDPAQVEIKERIAQLRGLRAGHAGVFLGVGSDEVIDLLIRITCKPDSDSILGQFNLSLICIICRLSIPLLMRKHSHAAHIRHVFRLCGHQRRSSPQSSARHYAWTQPVPTTSRRRLRAPVDAIPIS